VNDNIKKYLKLKKHGAQVKISSTSEKRETFLYPELRVGFRKSAVCPYLCTI